MSEQFKVPIACTRCGQQGWMLWQDGATRDAVCLLLDLSPPFYERIPSSRRFDQTETVCGRCGAIQPV